MRTNSDDFSNKHRRFAVGKNLDEWSDATTGSRKKISFELPLLFSSLRRISPFLRPIEMLMNSGPPNCSTLSSLSPPVIQFFFVEICFYPPISRSKFDVNSRGRNGEREEEGKKKTKERKTKKLHEIEERRGFKLKKNLGEVKRKSGEE